MRGLKICDAHLHCGEKDSLFHVVQSSEYQNRYPCYQSVQWKRMDRWEDLLREHGIEKTVLIPFVFRELDKSEQNRSLLLQSGENRYPFVLLDDDIDFLQEHCHQIAGIKQHFVMHESKVRPSDRELIALARDCRMTMILHTHWEQRADYVKELLSLFPGLKIQVAHLGRSKDGDFESIRYIVGQLKPFEQVTFDTSTVRDPEILTKMVDMIGSERVLFGSDFPFYMDERGEEDIFEAQILHVLKAGLTDRQRDHIFYENFERTIALGKKGGDKNGTLC